MMRNLLRRRARRVAVPVGPIVIATTALFVLAGCAAPPAPAAPIAPAAPAPTVAPTEASAATATFSKDDLDNAATLYKMRGHLLASLPAWQAGSFEDATTHANHPADELLSLVEKPLSGKNAFAPLKSALEAYAAIVGKAGDAAQAEGAQKAALDAVQASTAALAGDNLNTPAFKAAIARNLLESVEGEYSEAVTDGKVAKPAEYHDSMGYFTVAGEILAELDAGLKSSKPDQQKAITTHYGLLKANYPTFANVPDKPMSLEELEKHLDAVTGPLSEAFGLQQEAAPVADTIKAIREKIAASVEAYKGGKADQAYEEAASAYLEGFEKVEGDLGKVDRAFVGSAEGAFKQLRDAYKAGKPIAEIEPLVKQIDDILTKSEAMLKP